MSTEVFVLMDHDGKRFRSASWETLAMGQQLASAQGGTISALVLGSGISPLAQEVAGKDLNRVVVVDNQDLAAYDPDLASAALQQILSGEPPQVLLLAHIYQNIDLAPKLAGAMGRGLVTDCIDYNASDDGLTFVRQMFRNKLNAEVRISGSPPWIVTVQAGAFSADTVRDGSAEIHELTVDLSGISPRRIQLEAIGATKGKVDLTKAEVVIGVGRGIKKEENLEIVKELAEILGAEIGASRPVVDNDWLERERQIGSSGQTVNPKLYIAVGISGAIQHIVGMKGANCIVAINSDPNAPIFNVSTYGIVGDLFEVVPALIKRLAN